MDDLSGLAAERVRPLLRTRQVREFTDEPVARVDLDALADVARWSGSSSNSQPWRFIVVTDRDTVRKLGDAGLSQTRGLLTAAAAIAIVLPEELGMAVSFAYDEGRAAERILVGATMLHIAAGICWVLKEKRDAVHAILGVQPGWLVRTIVAVGHPTEAAKRPKAELGKARLPRGEVVFEERWPEG